MALRDFMRDVKVMEELQMKYLTRKPQLNHVFTVIDFFGAVSLPGRVCLVHEHAKYGSLDVVLSKYELSALFRVKVALDCANGIHLYHEYSLQNERVNFFTS